MNTRIMETPDRFSGLAPREGRECVFITDCLYPCLSCSKSSRPYSLLAAQAVCDGVAFFLQTSPRVVDLLCVPLGQKLL